MGYGSGSCLRRMTSSSHSIEAGRSVRQQMAAQLLLVGMEFSFRLPKSPTRGTVQYGTPSTKYSIPASLHFGLQRCLTLDESQSLSHPISRLNWNAKIERVFMCNDVTVQLPPSYNTLCWPSGAPVPYPEVDGPFGSVCFSVTLFQAFASAFLSAFSSTLDSVLWFLRFNKSLCP